jgi:outer membrane protein OmpA-like peptidoglycan-associated protein
MSFCFFVCIFDCARRTGPVSLRQSLNRENGKMMKTMKWMLAAVVAWSCGTVAAFATDEDLFDRAPWFTTLGLNYYHPEGDVEYDESIGVFGKLGYSFNSWWDLEGGLNFMPVLAAKDASELNKPEYALDDDQTVLRLSLSALLHLRAMENRRWDPFLRAGMGVDFLGKDVENGKTQPGVFIGGGLFYHFNDSWALRGDLVAGPGGKHTEFTALAEVGVSYRIGAEKVVPPEFLVDAGPGDVDSDGDGLFDKDEAIIGTDPYNPDTDGDGLSDGDEHFKQLTDPLNPDTDFDGLKDGAEVLTYKTNPLDIDTDKGGVSDGHEVIEDSTNPLDPADDLQKFTLLIEFDYDKSFIRPQYFQDIEPVLKVLRRDPGATVRVEGHADKRKKSTREYNQRLSERRANAVKDYLVQNSGINAANVTAVGYGFDRPVAPNDTEENMQHNRRTDIYIRKSGTP